MTTTHNWANKELAREGLNAPMKVYFVFTYLADTGFNEQVMIEADYFTPNRDDGERILMFPCPVCRERYRRTGDGAGHVIEYSDGIAANTAPQLTVRSSKKDFDVALDAWVWYTDPETKERKQLGPLVVVADRIRCPDCVDAASVAMVQRIAREAESGVKESRRGAEFIFDVVFEKLGVCRPVQHGIASWAPSGVLGSPE